jgi:long-chain acyl-CoA synthetase
MTQAVLRSGDRERTIDEVQDRAMRAGGALAALGVARGDHVALLLRNEDRFVEITMAIGLAGAVPVPVNSHWSGAEIAHVLHDSACVAVFAHADLVPLVEAAGLDVPIVELVEPPEVAEAFRLAAEATGRHPEYESFLTAAEPLAQPVPGAPMSVIYTSGTTGSPKGVLRQATPPEHAAAIAELVCTGLAFAPGMRTLIPAPLYHTAPNAHALFAVRLGCELTIMPRFDAEELLRLIEAHRVEHVQLVPTMFTRLLALPPEVRDRYDVSSLRSVVHAAAPCPPGVKRAMIDWWGPIVHEYYGGSELGIVVGTDTAGWLAHPGTVGRPLLDASVRILDEDGTEVPAGETGEIFLRPPSCWPDFTYLGMPQERAAIERDGHVSLGDVGRVDADGYLFLTDRVKDMVISGGVNIYPAEIEQALLLMEAVRDVAVFGVPDADWGEIVAAHVELHDGASLTEDEVRDHVRATMAGYKVPRVVVFEDLPRQETGKLFKRRLRARYLEGAPS